MANQTATPYAPLLKSLKRHGREGMAHEFIGDDYGTDGYRLWYETGAKMPDRLSRLIADQPANTAQWTITKELLSFVGIAKKAKATVRFTSDGLAFGGHLDEVTGKNHAPTPVVVDDVGLDPAYLLETLNYLLQGKKQGTLTVWLGRKGGIGPWYMSNCTRHALIMPKKIYR